MVKKVLAAAGLAAAAVTAGVAFGAAPASATTPVTPQAPCTLHTTLCKYPNVATHSIAEGVDPDVPILGKQIF